MLPTTWRFSTFQIPNHLNLPNLIKSNRINALRKQYDAFLDDDKKRKERNEYILEKLDKMRYCTAVVQVRKKPGITYDDRNAEYYNTPKETLGSPVVSTIKQRYIPVKDESILLKEISKNYILIPKLRSLYTDEYIQEVKPKNDESNDWKSKYDILEELKQKEKEDSSYTPKELYLLKAEKDTTHHIINASTTNQNDQLLFECEDDLTEQIQSENVIPFETTNYNENQNYNGNIYDTYNEKADIQESGDITVIYHPNKTNENIEDSQPQLVNSDNFEHISESTQKFATQDVDANINTTQNDTELYSSNNKLDPNQYTSEILPACNEKNTNENKDQITINVDKDTFENIDDGIALQVVNHNDLVNEINNDIYPNITTEAVEHTEYSTEIIDLQDFIPNDIQLQNEELIKSEQHVLVSDDSNLIYNDNTVPITDSNIETTVNHFDPIIVDSTEPTEVGIGALNVSNDENYYNEQLNENYVYDQEGVVENYNEEFTAPEENYQQEEYATYYEGARPENTFPSEVAENEETMQRYDQNYEQQYGTAYDGEHYQEQEYEQQYSQQGYEQHYEQGSEYADQQQPVEQAQSGNDQYETQDNTPQFVEQQLDNEEGYKEKQNENVETSKVEKPLDIQNNSVDVNEK